MRILLLASMFIGCGKSTGGVGMSGGGTPFEPNTDPPPPIPGDGDGDDTGTASPTDTATPADDTATSTVDADADAGPPPDGGEDTAFVIEGTGYGRDDVAYNLTVSDQSGLPFSLHDRYGSKIALVVGNLDVSTTADTLSNLQDIASDHPDVTFLAFIGRDATGIQCNQACASNVQSVYGFSPVLWEAAASLTTFNAWAQAQNTYTYLIDSSMVIDWTKTGTANGSQVDGQLDDLD
ncbi:MAG: hypothetical protein H8D71_00495 [Deltaproteobacteria bacterium]|nr:hypothetical protein [Deltaproteobacteria bacterium]